MIENPYYRAPKTQRRVVVTGLGAVTPLGLDVQTSWENALSGQSGINTVTQFNTEGFASRIAGEVDNFDPSHVLEYKEQKKMDRFIHFSLSATKMAIEDSNIEFDEVLKQKTGAFIGVGIGGLPIIEKQTRVYFDRGPNRLTPFFIPSVLTNLASGQVTIKYGFKGPNYSVTSACASGCHAIGEAVRYIREGICDVMIAGGAESTVNALAMGGFASMKALSTRNDRPQSASRPWDKDRDGFVLAEGCGIVILESYESAQKRGAKIYGEVTGYGTSSDAHHMTNPSPGGAGAALAMHLALQDASMNPEDIDYINAHGTSTPVGDEIETMGIKKVFSHHAKKLWISSTKSMTGHALGAAGAIETVFSLKSLETNIAPPTVNLENPSDGCDLDYIPGSARKGQFKHILNNSFGFGGTNACLVFSKV